MEPVSQLVQPRTQLGAAFDECHAYGHSWYDVDADKPPAFGYYIWVRCERCTTIRMDTVNHVGELLARSYVYPDGYKESGREGEIRLARTDFRLRLVARRTATGRLRKGWRR